MEYILTPQPIRLTYSAQPLYKLVLKSAFLKFTQFISQSEPMEPQVTFSNLKPNHTCIWLILVSIFCCCYYFFQQMFYFCRTLPRNYSHCSCSTQAIKLATRRTSPWMWTLTTTRRTCRPMTTTMWALSPGLTPLNGNTWKEIDMALLFIICSSAKHLINACHT